MASLCRDCENRILWVEIETRNGWKRIAVDPKPTDDGDLSLRPTHPDQPMVAERWRGRGPRYASHRKTCPEAEPDTYQDRTPSWVREPEGY